jgi:hypothetical protein
MFMGDGVKTVRGLYQVRRAAKKNGGTGCPIPPLI